MQCDIPLLSRIREAEAPPQTMPRVLLFSLSIATMACHFPVDPAPFSPEEPLPLAGPPIAHELEPAPLGEDRVAGQEDFAFDRLGRLFSGTVDGKIILRSGSEPARLFADTGGRPLGMQFDGKGQLYVADSQRGLLGVSAEGRVRVLATSSEGVPFGFPNDVAIGPDGKVYLTDASSKYSQEDYLYDLVEARPHGRLIVYDPETGDVATILSDLYFANGVELDAEGQFVLVSESYRYRVKRLWLSGPKRGQVEIFLKRLPGIPDAISRDSNGTYWIAFYTRRNALMDAMHPFPWLKSLLAVLPSIRPILFAIRLGGVFRKMSRGGL